MPLFLRLTRTIVGELAITRVPIKLEPERSGDARLKIRPYSENVPLLYLSEY